MDTSRGLLTRSRAKIVRPENVQTSTNSGGQRLSSFLETPKSSTLHKQLQSSFFSKLPVDARTLIYKQLLANLGGALHIATAYAPQREQGKQICQPCIAAPEDHIEFKSGSGAWGETHTKCQESAKLKIRTTSQPRTFMPLLLSCQRM